MEIAVASDDAAEVRRVIIYNRSSAAREIEMTSYAEIVLAAARCRPGASGVR